MNTVVTHSNLKRYFSECIENAMQEYKIDADAHTKIYLSGLLENFSLTENLFERTEDGLQLKPLALYYADAAAANTLMQRMEALRKLGDIALFISALFSQRLAKKPVDVDYYIAMGGSAYAHLYNQCEQGKNPNAFATIYFELSSRFVQFMDVLSHINKHNRAHTELLRQYELWNTTGSKAALLKLTQAGFDPYTAINTTKH